MNRKVIILYLLLSIQNIYLSKQLHYNLIYFQLMPKRTAKQQNSDEEEQVEDIMAWGNRRENYYQ